MNTNKDVLFVDSPSQFYKENAYLAYIPPVKTDAELFEALSEQLHFPDYWGRNWDGLYDIFAEVEVEPFQIFVVHEDLSGLPANDYNMYIEVAQLCIDDWKDDPEHHLTFIFNSREEARIRSLLRIREISRVRDLANYTIEGAYMVRIPPVKTAEELMVALAQGLHFPSCFDGTFECLEKLLCDLSWIPTRDIVILHESVAGLPKDLVHMQGTYTRLTHRVIWYWREHPEHVVQIASPSDEREFWC